jgi:hypothetical protein
MGVCEEKIWPRDAEEFPLREGVSRKRYLKTQQAGKGLAVAV